MKQERINGKNEGDERHRGSKPPAREAVDAQPGTSIAAMQQTIGNRAVQRLIAQRSADTPAELDDETAARINRESSGGQPLDQAVQKQVGPALGADFSGVRVHTSSEADSLNEELNARAFTTGKDIFFRDGEYQPNSSGGQELIAHELTHVVQQSSGAVGSSGSRMTVNAPGDPYEHEADSIAKAVTSTATGKMTESMAGVQRQSEEDEVQMKAMVPDEEDDEEELKKK